MRKERREITDILTSAAWKDTGETAVKPHATEITGVQYIIIRCLHKQKRKNLYQTSFHSQYGETILSIKIGKKRNYHVLLICHFISNFSFSYNKFPQVSQSNSLYYLLSKNNTTVIFMNVVLLVHNLGDEVNRAGRTKRIPGLVIKICQIYPRIIGIKDIKLVAVFIILG